MFGFLKNLFHKPTGTPPIPTATPAPARPASARLAPAHTIPTKAPSSGNGAYQTVKGLELPVSVVLNALPPELRPRVKTTREVKHVSIPLDKVLAQLARGVVKISFGELRRYAPDCFSGAADADAVPIILPLAEIISRLNPALISRRRTQKQVQIPAEIGSPFDGQGKGLSISSTNTKSQPPVAAGPSPAQPNPMPAPAGSPSLAPRGSLNAVPSQPAPSLSPALSAGSRLTAPASPEIAPQLPPAVPIAFPAKKASEHNPLQIPVSALAENWPPGIRHELFQFNLLDAKLALPYEIIEQALQRGKITFDWKRLRSWMTPAPLPAVSPHDQQVLELPLSIVAPLFLASNAGARRRQKVSVDESIPNLFFGRTQSEGAPAASGAPVLSGNTAAPAPAPTPAVKSNDTNFYPAEDLHAKPSGEAGRGERSLGTSFVARNATPNEIVSRAAALDGVAGALIALPDGLMVASQVSADLNGDTLAAFLPQIMGKVSQCTKELRMGELNNLNFTVGQVPWKIFRVNAIFFAAFGRPGEPLPTGQLAALAAELDRKPK